MAGSVCFGAKFYHLNIKGNTDNFFLISGDYKLFCDDCGKGFFTQSKLDSHKRKHTGKKHCHQQSSEIITFDCSVVDPDPFSEYGSGSTHVNIG